MILVSSTGLMSACSLVRETPKAWIVQYRGERGGPTRVDKNGSRVLVNSVAEAEDWLVSRIRETSYKQ